jgi:ABC-type nitrate/sulfonate/bicarbonate transport system substrate-binding protein
VIQHGFKILEWGFGSKYTAITAVYVRNSFLEANEELVQDFCRALVENLKYIYEHIEEAALWVAQSPYLAQDFETIKVALRVLAGLPDPRIPLPKEAENTLVPWRRDVPDILEQANAFMKAHPPTGTSWEGVPNLQAKINNKYIIKAIREIAPKLYGKLL